MSLDAVISADLVKTRAEIAALNSSLAAARSEVAGLSNQVSSSTVIKSVQRGRIDTPANATGGTTRVVVSISPVNPAKASMTYLGSTGVRQWNNEGILNGGTVALISGSQIEGTCTLPPYTGYGTGFSMSWELVEFK
ncbi:hypothetical protein [Delftia sp. RIT313]|uniref:hypothetical protein n=1 Tax=Delftia sp. RIT313 TaxID=1468410 RepID=UPI000450C013|nr:hypothetical protein [Delftia sp. RIT313]EZP50352.1 hypothetical protein BW39_04455 [Delftia sp. RIT313]